MERFQDLENVKVVSENGKGITRRNANANERVLSWRETAAHAGVVTMVTNQEEESNVVEPTQPHGNKRKTPKQYRLAPPKLAKNREITAANKHCQRHYGPRGRLLYPVIWFGLVDLVW